MAQTPGVAFRIDLKDYVFYQVQTSDYAQLASDPGQPVADPDRAFGSFVGVADIVAVNGRPAKGSFVDRGNWINLKPNAKPGQAIADTNQRVAADGFAKIPGFIAPTIRERLAQRESIAVRVARLPMSAVLRTEATDETQGFMKAIVGRDDDRILGFTMIGAEAGEVMAAVQTAILGKLPYQTLRDAVLTHPTMAEGLGSLFENVPQASSVRVEQPLAATA